MAKLHSLVIPICLVIGAIVVSFLGFYEGWITNTSDYTTLVVSGVVVAMLGSSGPLFRRAFTQETISQVEPIISCKVNPRRLGSNDKILLKGKSLSVFVSVGHGENVALDAVVHEGGNAPLKRARVMAKFKLLEIGIPPKPERITGQSNESYQLSLSSHEEIKQSLENQCFPSGVVQIGNEHDVFVDGEHSVQLMDFVGYISPAAISRLQREIGKNLNGPLLVSRIGEKTSEISTNVLAEIFLDFVMLLKLTAENLSKSVAKVYHVKVPMSFDTIDCQEVKLGDADYARFQRELSID